MSDKPTSQVVKSPLRKEVLIYNIAYTRRSKFGNDYHIARQ